MSGRVSAVYLAGPSGGTVGADAVSEFSVLNTRKNLPLSVPVSSGVRQREIFPCVLRNWLI